MPRFISIDIQGAEEILNTLRTLGNNYPRAAGNALFRWGSLYVEKPAKTRLAPVVFGALRSSIQTLAPEVTSNSASVTIAAGGAAAPYAKAVHENPRAGQTGGYSPSGKKYKHWSRVGQWKFLETPAMEAAQSRQGELARECGIELERVIRGTR